MPLLWKNEVDVHIDNPVTNEWHEIDFSSNAGKGKYHPGAPTCTYKGKEVDCLTFASESGGITGDILINILSYFDSINLFPRHPGGPIPMVAVDCHQRCLDPGFVKYINESHHKWKVCFGVPYATIIWQVGDASEQNGKFKTEWYRVKADFMTWKYGHLLPLVLGPTDIMSLLNAIFHDSYGNVVSNKPTVGGVRRIKNC